MATKKKSSKRVDIAIAGKRSEIEEMLREIIREELKVYFKFLAQRSEFLETDAARKKRKPTKTKKEKPLRP